MWGKTLVICTGVDKMQWSIATLRSVKANAVSLSVWESLDILSVVFWAREDKLKKHFELNGRKDLI